MRPPKLKPKVRDVDDCSPMSIDFGDDDVADLASSQDILTLSDMLDHAESQQDIISDSDEGWQHVSDDPSIYIGCATIQWIR